MKTQAEWDRIWMADALAVALKSKDPSTRVGAVLTTFDNDKITEGWNGFPRGIADTDERLADRDMKLQLVVHGEMNAVFNAVRMGVSLRNTRLYMVATDKSGALWGGPPCTRCVVECIQAGIVEYVSYPLKLSPSRWHASCEFAGSLIREAGLTYREVPLI